MLPSFTSVACVFALLLHTCATLIVGVKFVEQINGKIESKIPSLITYRINSKPTAMIYKISLTSANLSIKIVSTALLSSTVLSFDRRHP